MKYIGSILILLLALNGCRSKDEIRPNSNTTDLDPWLVPVENIIHMDAEKDKIQSLDSNIFIPIVSSRINDNDIVFAYQHEGVTRIYPLSIMGGHEITNDYLADYYYSITFCPLTGSALAWDREINGKVTQYGVSGKLLKSNLIPYDRNTGSHWSQMKNICINGDLIGEEPVSELLIETRFSTIKAAYPDAEVLEHLDCEDGICRLKSGDDLGDPGDGEPVGLPPDARYFGVVIDQNLQLFEFDLFAGSIHVYKTRFRSQNLVIVGSRELHFFVAFQFTPKNVGQEFFPVQNALPIVMRDSNGNSYDMFGNIIVGPDAGERLLSPTSYVANTFAWEELFDDITVFQPE